MQKQVEETRSKDRPLGDALEEGYPVTNFRNNFNTLFEMAQVV